MRHSKIFISFFYLCPLIFYYLLPATYEKIISIDIGFFSFFVPEFSIVILLFLYNRRKYCYSFPFEVLKISIIVMIIFGLISCVPHVNTHHVSTWYTCVVMFHFFSIILFCFYFSIKESLIDTVKYFILVLFLILSFEIITFSLGIFTWRIALSAYSYGGIQRINSTIGPATGTAMVYYLLSIWTAELFYNYRKMLLFIIASSCITMMITMTRSGNLMMLILFLIFFVKYLFKKKKNSKIKFIVSISFLLVAIFFTAEKIGVIDSFQLRIEEADLYDTYTDDYGGRYHRGMQAINFIIDNPLIGASPGHFHIRENYAIDNIGYGAPHNSYLLFAAEYGIVPLVFFSFSLFLILFRIIKYMPNSIVANGLIVFFIVGMNTETVIVEHIAWYYLLFLMISYYFWKTYTIRTKIKSTASGCRVTAKFSAP